MTIDEIARFADIDSLKAELTRRSYRLLKRIAR
jgi:hypothetical protein